KKADVDMNGLVHESKQKKKPGSSLCALSEAI
ncbi:MAG: hypothetical protein RL386_1089, partial [Bacteroidota bacterium]